MDDRNDGIDMRSDFDRELDDMADKISKHGDDIIDRDDSNNRRQRRANRYDDDDMDAVLTFDELTQWLKEADISLEKKIVRRESLP